VTVRGREVERHLEVRDREALIVEIWMRDECPVATDAVVGSDGAKV